ncbi:MAG: hypothetical protein NC411_06770 [Bacteroides sp.]|nr:hypothetical protein [Bacteroides sp.]
MSVNLVVWVFVCKFVEESEHIIIMKMKFRLSMLPLLAVFVAGLLTVSCSKEQKLLDAIPTTVSQVGTVRLKSALEQAGCSFENGEATMPAGVDDPGRFGRLIRLVGALDASGVANPDDVAWAMDDEGDFLMTILVDDRDRFREASSELIEWTDDTGGFACGNADGLTVLLNDERVWFSDVKPSEAVGKVDSMVKEAKKSSVSSMTGIAQLLSSDNLVRVAVRQEEAKSGDRKKVKGENENLEVKWATLTVNVEDNKIVGRSSIMEADGKPVAIKGLKEINPAVLAYVPENFNVAVGFGVSPEFDWSVLTKAVGTLGGFQAQAMLSAVTPYLQSIDGTIFLAAGPANQEAYSDIEPGNWQFIAMVRLPQQKINDIMGMMRSSLFMAGISPKIDKDGIMMMPQYGMNLYMGNVDGYFAVSNIPFEANRRNSLASLFTGKSGALSLEIPRLSELGAGLPDYGIDVKAQMMPDATELRLSLGDSDQPVLKALLTALL